MSYPFSRMTKQTIFLLTLVVFLAGCGEKTPQDQHVEKETAKTGVEPSDLPEGLTAEAAAKVVAKVGERTITVGDVTRQINRLSPYIRRRWAAPEKRKEFLDKLVRVELLSQEAERLGLAEDPEVQRTAKQVMIRLMVKNDLETELFPSEIENDLLEAEYEKEKDKYHRPAQVRASHILLATKAEAEKVLADLNSKASDNQYFRKKAKDLSIDESTKVRGGDIGYFSKNAEKRDDEPEVDPALVEATWKLESNGDISKEIIKTDKGFHIVKLTNKRSEMNRSFESVKRMIENKLLREKRAEIMQSFIADLKSKAKIEIFKENLAKADFSVKESEGIPGVAPKGMKPLVKQSKPQ